MLDHDSDVSELPKGRVQVFSFRVAHSSRLGSPRPTGRVPMFLSSPWTKARFPTKKFTNAFYKFTVQSVSERDHMDVSKRSNAYLFGAFRGDVWFL